MFRLHANVQITRLRASVQSQVRYRERCIHPCRASTEHIQDCHRRTAPGSLIGGIVSRRRMGVLLRSRGLSLTECGLSQHSRHIQSLSAHVALKMFTLVIHASKGGERGITVQHWTCATQAAKSWLTGRMRESWRSRR